MKNPRILATRLALVALMAIAATASFAQGFDGPPQGGPRGGRGPGGPGGMGGPQAFDRLPSLAMLAGRPEVVQEVGITEDQWNGIQEIAQSMRPQRPQGGDQDGPPDFKAMQAQREKAEAAADAKVKSLLSAAQVKRLTEIQIQSMGLTAALVPSVQTKLGLSDAQKTRLKALVPTPGQGGPGGPGGGPGGGGFGGPGGGPGGDIGGPPPDGQGGPGGGFGRGPGGQGGPGGRNDARKKELETKIAAILTDEQKANLKALGGKTFAWKQGQGRPPQGG